MSAAFVARTLHVPAAPKVIAPVVGFSEHCAEPAPPTNEYDTPPVPEPPAVRNVNVPPNVSDDAFVSVNAAWAAGFTVNDWVCCAAAANT